MHFLELEVVEKLLEEEMLVGSSNHWVKLMLMRLVIWVVSIEDEEVSLVDGVLEGALGALEALEIEALVDAMDVDNG
ncbi:hypothetical protein Tco_0427687 [Tanacetum coccineum]